MKSKIYLVTLVLAGMNFTLTAQSSDNFVNGMIERINQYYLSTPHDNLYVHTDRSVYFPGDLIYLEAFVADAATLMPSQNSNQFNLMLVDNEGSKVYSSTFVINNGRISANFQVPENIAHGPYKLIGYTMNNSVNTSNKVFNKQIFLADPELSFMVDYDLDKESYQGGDQLGLTLNYYAASGKPMKGINVDYAIKDHEKTITEGSLKSGKEGSVVISYSLPADPGSNMLVEILSQRRKESQPITISVPIERTVNRIVFHPEGGALIAGSAGKVAYRAYDDAGLPVDFSASLYGDGKKIRDITSYVSGVGSFELIPEKGKNYEIRAGSKNFALPSLTTNGAALRITGQTGGKVHAAIARAGDDFPGSTPVLVAVMRKGLLYWSAPGTLEQTEKMDLPSQRIPSGVSTLAVFTKDGELLSSRTFYLEAQSIPELEIAMDKAEYKNRQKVVANISVLGKVPASADNISLSVSVVPQDMLLDRDLLIDDYMMIESDIQEDGQALLEKYSKTGDTEILDAMLMALTWNGYSWDYALGAQEESDISGEVMSEEQALAYSTLSYPQEFNAAPMMDFAMGIMDKRHPGVGEPMYKRQLENGMSVLEVIKTIKPYTTSGGKILFQGVNSFINQQGALIIIDGQQVGDNASVLSSINPTEVESINISTNPGEIQKYTGLNVVGVIDITLKGSSIESRLVNTSPRDELVRESRGSYLVGYPDYSIENDSRLVMEDHRSLLYWNPEVQLNENNMHQLEFYTSDDEGSFVITVQGMIGLNPVAKQLVFEVK